MNFLVVSHLGGRMELSISSVSVVPGIAAAPPLPVDTKTGTSYLTNDAVFDGSAVSGAAIGTQQTYTR